MPPLRLAALRWREQQRRAMVVEVVAHQGSVPREAGTRMLVGDGEVLGTIGGGHLEQQAIERARALLRAPGEGATQHIALGPSLGQCCGGAIDLRYTPLSLSEPAAWPEPAPRFSLQLYGAGHVGRAIVHLLAGIDCRVQWIDERESEFPKTPLPAHIDTVCVEPVEAEVRVAPPGCFYLVLTHSHALDLAITRAILARGDFAWFGLIGSRSKRAAFERRLRDAGLDEPRIARITCPIGLPGIGGKEPEVIAVAVVAQLLSLTS